MTRDISHLAPGDTAWEVYDGYPRYIKRVTVDRVTKTLVIAGNARYRKKDGAQIGSHGFAFIRQLKTALTSGETERFEESLKKAAIRKINNALEGKSLDELKVLVKELCNDPR